MRRALFLASTIFLVSACSLVSGWSDLQGGAAGGRKDAAAPTDGAAATDGSSSGEAGGDGSTSSGLACGNVRCSGAQGCCHPAPGSGEVLRCADAVTCSDTFGAFLKCDGRGSCSGATPACCFDFGNFTGQCAASCAAGVETLCNPVDVPACTTGACNGTVPGYPTLRSCQ